MNRLGLLIAICAALVIGLLFALWPEFDLRAASLFFDPASGFFLSRRPFLMRIRDIAMWVAAFFVALAVFSLAIAALRGPTRSLLSGRTSLFLILTMVLGPGLLVNGVLKDHWHRPRPVQVTEFGGTKSFMPWWNPTGSCERNCSFVAGEASGAFWTLAPAALAPPAWRAIAVTAAVGFGLAVGALRMSFGAHFLSDVLFAGIAIYVLIWIFHGLFFRWPGAERCQQSIDRALAGIGQRARTIVGVSGGGARPARSGREQADATPREPRPEAAEK